MPTEPNAYPCNCRQPGLGGDCDGSCQHPPPSEECMQSSDKTTATRPPKKVLNALEKVFAAEINGRLPFQSKAMIYRDLLAAGFVASMQRTFGQGWRAVTVSGYELTHAGRYLYCANCEDTDAE